MPQRTPKSSATVRTGLEPVLDEIRRIRTRTLRDAGGTVRGYLDLVQRRTNASTAVPLRPVRARRKKAA